MPRSIESRLSRTRLPVSVSSTTGEAASKPATNKILNATAGRRLRRLVCLSSGRESGILSRLEDQ